MKKKSPSAAQSLIRLVTQRLRVIVAPAVGIVVLSYFAYHLVQGDRGLLAMVRLNHDTVRLEHELKEITEEKKYWEKRTRMLRPESVDPDMLNEMARKTLGFVDQDDIILPRPLMPNPS